MGGSKFRAFFSPLPPQFSFFWWCLKRRGPDVHVWSSLGRRVQQLVIDFFGGQKGGPKAGGGGRSGGGLSGRGWSGGGRCGSLKVVLQRGENKRKTEK